MQTLKEAIKAGYVWPQQGTRPARQALSNAWYTYCEEHRIPFAYISERKDGCVISVDLGTWRVPSWQWSAEQRHAYLTIYADLLEQDIPSDALRWLYSALPPIDTPVSSEYLFLLSGIPTKKAKYLMRELLTLIHSFRM